MAMKISEKLSKMTMDGRFDFPLHMVKEKKTEMYVKFAKVMIICQGPYTKARCDNILKVESIFKSSSRVLSDATYQSELKTRCTSDTTTEFYEYLKFEVKRAFELGYNLIYIDSTMSNKNQNEYYCALANKMQYSILILPPVITERIPNLVWPLGSQADSFHELKTRIEAPNMFNHLFCGWFLHDIDSDELRNECVLYANDLFDNIPTFQDWFKKVGDGEDFSKFYNLTQDDVKKADMVMREDLAFCPVKIFSSEYHIQKYFEKFVKEQYVVRENYGKMNKLHIVGFVISPHMVAARVKLTQKQKDLWEMEDNINENAYVVENCPSELYKESRTNLPEADIQRICSKSNNTIIRGESFHEPSKAIHVSAKGRTCHIVLGISKKAKPVEVDYGVAFAVNRENKYERSDKKEDMEMEVMDIGRSEVRKIGKYWMIYMKDTIMVNGFFTSCCKPCDFESPLTRIK